MSKQAGKVRKIMFSVVTGFILSFCCTAGYYLDNYASLDLFQSVFYWKLGLGTAFGSVLAYGLFELAERKYRKVGNAELGRILVFADRILKSRILCMTILILCWLPALLSLFPGAFAYDARNEWEQVAQGHINAHHPVIHILWAGGLVETMHTLTGNYNVGIALYTLMQMLLLAYVFATVVHFMREVGLPVVFCLFALIFYSLSPTVQLFAISTTKDVPFSAAFLMFFLYMIRFYCKRGSFYNQAENWVYFGLWAFMTMIFRNNGLYVVMLTLIIMVADCLRRKRFRRQFCSLLAVLALMYGLYTGPIYRILHIAPGGYRRRFPFRFSRWPECINMSMIL